MEKPKVIRDPVHKDVFLTELEMELVDTPAFQRLRRVKQLGVTNLVYPSANHTRFEHSIGTAHIAGRIVKRLALGEEETTIKISALLHDIGHGPLSHTSEELLKRYLKYSHEDATLKIIKKSEVHDILVDNSIDVSLVERILSKKDRMSGLISGEVDVDRMDYLARDAYHTGVAYGVIDLDRLVNTVELVEGKLVIGQGGLRAVEGLLVARFLMTPTVYLHHASRIADAMFLRATERAVEEDVLELDVLFGMDDIDLQALFRKGKGYVREIGKRLDDRRLFKQAWFRDERGVDEDLKLAFLMLMGDLKLWKNVEEKIAEDCGLEPGYVIVDIPPRAKYEERNALVYNGEKTERLDKVSPIVKILQDTQSAQWSVGIYTPQEHVEKVAKVCLEIERYLP
jgi:putative nucleotidyltransferase with HDIG domain